MFDKEEAKALKRRFWTGFGKQMGRHVSARGPKQKWLNYRTGVRHLFFRLHADKRLARVSIDIQHPDPGIRELFFAQWEEYKVLLHNLTAMEWTWSPSTYLDSGQEIARISVERAGLNMFVEENWQEIWDWFEPVLVGLDELWGNAVEVFQDFAK